MTTEPSAQCPTNRSYCHYDVASWLDWMKQQVLHEWWHSLGGSATSMGEPGGGRKGGGQERQLSAEQLDRLLI